MKYLHANPAAAVNQVLESLLAGVPPPAVQTALGQLPTRVERQEVLCTACGILAEVAASCRERGEEIAAVLASNCKVFEPSRTPCMLQRVYGINLDGLSAMPQLPVLRTVA